MGLIHTKYGGSRMYSGARAWIPTDESGLLQWIEPSSLAADGSAWTDLSSNGATGTQANPALRPSKVAGSTPGAQFALTQYLDGPLVRAADPALTLVQIVKFDVAGNSIVWTANDLYRMLWFGSGPGIQYGSNLTVFTNSSTSPLSLCVDATHVHGSNGPANVYLNNVFQQTGIAFDIGATTTFRIGATAGGALGFQGILGASLLYDHVLSASVRAKAVSYVNAIWGL